MNPSIKRDIPDIERDFPDLQELNCDNCGKPICFVCVFDLKSSHFYCMECVEAEGGRKEIAA